MLQEEFASLSNKLGRHRLTTLNKTFNTKPTSVAAGNGTNKYVSIRSIINESK
jgi:hypothetical protein